MKQQHWRFKQAVISFVVLLCLTWLNSRQIRQWVGDESNIDSVTLTLPRSSTMIHQVESIGPENSWPPIDVINSILADSSITTTSVSNTVSKHGVPRLVVAASNSEYVDFADNFANSLLAVNITNFALVPLDRKAYRILRRAHPNHTLPILPGLESHKEGDPILDSPEYDIIFSYRPLVMQYFLKKGYSILYNDVDMVWQSNA
jgi:hypothetical protein